MGTLGCVSDSPSDRDWVFEDLSSAAADGDVDMRKWCSRRGNQLWTNSCVGHALTNALEMCRIRSFGPEVHEHLSPLMLYWAARDSDGGRERTELDDGATIRGACNALRRWGVCRESTWPFLPFGFWVRRRPSDGAFGEADSNRIDAHYRITSTGEERVDQVIRALRQGWPVVYGTVVGRNWQQYRAWPWQRRRREALEPLRPTDEPDGRHATTLVGWKDGLFIGENSWGGFRWGKRGFYEAVPEVVSDSRARDFWVIIAG